MTHKIHLTGGRVGLLSGAALIAALMLLAGPNRAAGQDRPLIQVQIGAAVQDDYVYYPQYETYYSSSRHQYGYREGNAWVWRPAPPHVGVNVLLGSPSVHMDFHDSPEKHHEATARSYPRNWKQPDRDHGDHDDHRDDRKDGDHKH